MSRTQQIVNVSKLQRLMILKNLKRVAEYFSDIDIHYIASTTDIDGVSKT